MKLSVWAKQQGISYNTAWRMFNAKQIIGSYQLPTGTVIVPELKTEHKQEHVVVYARVSSSENKTNLDSQAERVCQFCSAKGWIVNELVKECASGLNDARPKLQKILKARKATRIVVEHWNVFAPSLEWFVILVDMFAVINIELVSLVMHNEGENEP
jgi:predicted site-specific integrase-resolvase